MYLEKPKRLIIWHGGSTNQCSNAPEFFSLYFHETFKLCRPLNPEADHLNPEPSSNHNIEIGIKESIRK